MREAWMTSKRYIRLGMKSGASSPILKLCAHFWTVRIVSQRTISQPHTRNSSFARTVSCTIHIRFQYPRSHNRSIADHAVELPDWSRSGYLLGHSSWWLPGLILRISYPICRMYDIAFALSSASRPNQEMTFKAYRYIRPITRTWELLSAIFFLIWCRLRPPRVAVPGRITVHGRILCHGLFSLLYEVGEGLWPDLSWLLDQLHSQQFFR